MNFKSCARHVLGMGKMDKLQEALSLMNALCNTSITLDDISDELTNNLEQKKAFIKMFDNTKAAVDLQLVERLNAQS